MWRSQVPGGSGSESPVAGEVRRHRTPARFRHGGHRVVPHERRLREAVQHEDHGRVRRTAFAVGESGGHHLTLEYDCLAQAAGVARGAVMTSPVPEDKLRLGGMALRNGLLVHGPTHWAAAVRTDDGEMKVASGPKPNLGGKAAERLPGVRGVVKLAEAMAVIPLVKRALPEARLPMQDVRTLGAMGAAALGGQAIRTAGSRTGARTAGREAAVALVSLAPALLALRSGDLAAYHGVEHKSIAAYEDGEDAAAPTRSTTAAAPTSSRRCSRRPRSGTWPMRRAGLRGPAAEAAVGLGSAAVAVEVFAWGERHPDSRCHADAAPARLRDPARDRHARADRASSSRSAEAALARSCAWRARRRPRPWPPRPAAGRGSIRRSSGLPVEKIREGYYTDAYFNLTRQLLGDGTPPARDRAGLPEHGLDARRDRRGDRGPQALLGRLERPRGPRAARGRRDRAVGDRDDDRGRLRAVRPPRDRLPRLPGAPHADHAQRPRGRRGGRAASRSSSSPPATTTGSSRPATAGRRTWPARSASPPTRRPRGGAAAASAPSRTG